MRCRCLSLILYTFRLDIRNSLPNSFAGAWVGFPQIAAIFLLVIFPLFIMGLVVVGYERVLIFFHAVGAYLKGIQQAL